MYATLVLTASLAILPGAEPSKPALGAPVIDFALPDTQGQLQRLSAYKDKKVVILFFVGTQCPVSNLYVATLTDLQKEYQDRGVQVLAINSNLQDSATDVAAHARERKIPFPVLKDARQEVADLVHASRTPEVFLLDRERTLRYYGRVDDQYGVGYRKTEPTQHELKNALDQVLAGKPVTTPTAPAAGCLIVRAKKSDDK